jgi:hypothetical protein
MTPEQKAKLEEMARVEVDNRTWEHRADINAAEEVYFAGALAAFEMRETEVADLRSSLLGASQSLAHFERREAEKITEAVKSERERIWSSLIDSGLDSNEIEDAIFNPLSDKGGEE